MSEKDPTKTPPSKFKPKPLKGLSYFLLIFIFCFAFHSCEKEEFLEVTQSTAEESENSSRNYDVKRIFKTEINENTYLKKKLKHLVKGNLQQGGELGREIYSTEYNFTIETISAIYINSLSENYHSYTFKIERENPEYLLENLILSFSDSLEVYHTYVQTYDITQEELNAINSEEYVDLEGKISLFSIDGSEIVSDFLNKEMVTINESCPITTSTCFYGNHTFGEQGDCNVPETITYTHTWVDCSWDLDPNEGVPGGGSSGGGGGGDGTPDNDYDGSDPDIHGNGGGVTSSPNTGCRGGAKCIELEAPEEDIELALNEELEENPFLLLDIDCDQIQHWQNLAQHTAPQSVQSKIDNLPSNWANDFEIQPLDEANGTVVNLDYFSVNVTSLPTDPATSQQFSADEFLDYIRRNMDNFVEDSTFEPYCEISSMCQTETSLWDSTNPLGAIVYIDIPVDHGVVVCTEYTNNYWYFMTMNAPYAGNHPVSGTRQFGYEQNSNGSYNFFVRGVDRFDSNVVENLAYGLSGFDNAFSGADALWESFQTKTEQFVNNNGGASSSITPTTNRPDWEEIQDVLQGNKPISDLGCH